LTAWLLRGALILNISLGLSYAGLWISAARQDLLWRADFTAFYTGGAIVRDGQGAHLYDAELQTRYQQQILEGRSFKDGVLLYNYPPHVVFLFAPLAWLPRSTAFVIWTLAQGGLLVWLLLLLRRIAQSWERNERWLLLSAVVALPSLLTTFLLGAFSLLVLICLLQFYYALKQGRQAQSGLWLVVGIVKPQNILLPGVLLLGARRWRALVGAALIGAAVVLVSSVLLGWHTWLDFLNLLRTASGFFGIYGIDPTTMYNFKGTLALILGNAQGVLINQISLAALIIVVLLTLFLWRGPWRPDEPSFELRLAFTLLLGLLFSVHLNPQDGLMLVAPALLFYMYLRQRNLPRRAYAAFVLSCPLVFLVSEFTVKGSLGIRIPVVAMTVLAAWMGWALYNERKTFAVLAGQQSAPNSVKGSSD
jgi:hypothetical protein